MMIVTNLLEQCARVPVVLGDTPASRLIQAHWLENLMMAMLFLFGLALVLQGAWNGLLAEFPRIGRLSYFRAVHTIAVLGVIVSVIVFLLF